MIKWSKHPEMIEWIDRMCKQYTDEQLAPMFVEHFGVPIGHTAIKGMRGRYGIHTGRDGCFKKGNEPWSSGLKGKGIMKPNKGSFKKGSRPHNWKPLGSERICSKDNIVLVKVKDTGKLQKDWQSKHSLIWEKQHGQKVPSGHVVMFADGDNRNFEIDNLVLVHRSVNCLHNKRGYSHAPKQIRPSLLAIAQIDKAIMNKEREK